MQVSIIQYPNYGMHDGVCVVHKYNDIVPELWLELVRRENDPPLLLIVTIPPVPGLTEEETELVLEEKQQLTGSAAAGPAGSANGVGGDSCFC